MALPPLATTDDLEALLGRELTDDEETRAEALLRQASARVRRYTRNTFTFVADDVQVLRPVGTRVRLRSGPVTAVARVIAVAGYTTIPDLELPPGSWTWDGADIVDIMPPSAHWLLSVPEAWSDGSAVDTYRITYSHGYPEIPDDVIGVVCGMVMRVLLAPSQTPGIVSERIGQYNYQMQQGTGSQGAVLTMSKDDKDALADFRPRATTIQLTGT